MPAPRRGRGRGRATAQLAPVTTRQTRQADKPRTNRAPVKSTAAARKAENKSVVVVESSGEEGARGGEGERGSEYESEEDESWREGEESQGGEEEEEGEEFGEGSGDGRSPDGGEGVAGHGDGDEEEEEEPRLERRPRGREARQHGKWRDQARPANKSRPVERGGRRARSP